MKTFENLTCIPKKQRAKLLPFQRCPSEETFEIFVLEFFKLFLPPYRSNQASCVLQATSHILILLHMLSEMCNTNRN